MFRFTCALAHNVDDLLECLLVDQMYRMGVLRSTDTVVQDLRGRTVNCKKNIPSRWFITVFTKSNNFFRPGSLPWCSCHISFSCYSVRLGLIEHFGQSGDIFFFCFNISQLQQQFNSAFSWNSSVAGSECQYNNWQWPLSSKASRSHRPTLNNHAVGTASLNILSTKSVFSNFPPMLRFSKLNVCPFNTHVSHVIHNWCLFNNTDWRWKKKIIFFYIFYYCSTLFLDTLTSHSFYGVLNSYFIIILLPRFWFGVTYVVGTVS
jgi:hypothetical protein